VPIETYREKKSLHAATTALGAGDEEETTTTIQEDEVTIILHILHLPPLGKILTLHMTII